VTARPHAVDVLRTLKVQAIAASVGGPAGFSSRLVLDGAVIASTGGIFPVNGSLIPTADGLANAGSLPFTEQLSARLPSMPDALSGKSSGTPARLASAGSGGSRIVASAGPAGSNRSRSAELGTLHYSSACS
jgi:hypothetical protein